MNNMPSKVLEWKTPCEMPKGENKCIFPLKVFGCVCFVKNNRLTVEKLDPRAVKCIFVGYSVTQKGYVCWSPVERKLFVSMDVTFRELESYYSSDVNSSFDDSPDTGGIRREGKNSGGETQVTMGSIPCPCPMGESDDESEDESQEEENQTQGELRVYRRRKQNECQQNDDPMPVPAEIDVPQSLLSQPTSTPEATYQEYISG